MSWVTLPARTAVAAAEIVLATRDVLATDGPVRRPGGYGERLDVLLAEGGAVEALARLADPDGPLARIEQLAQLTGDDRPLGRALAVGGPLDRVLAEGGAVERLMDPDGPVDRLLADGGALDRLLSADGPLDRLLADDGALDRLTLPGGMLDRLLEPDGVLEQLFAEDGLVDRLLADDGPVDQLGELSVALQRLGTLDEVLSELSLRLATLPDLPAAIRAVEAEVHAVREEVVRVQPSLKALGSVIDRLPGPRRRARLQPPPD